MGSVFVNNGFWQARCFTRGLFCLLFLLNSKVIAVTQIDDADNHAQSKQASGDADQEADSQDVPPEGFWNLKTKTLGGRQFWTDYRHASGWRIQRNHVTEHYRLLDGVDYRHAWGNLAHCQRELEKRITAGHVKLNSGKVVILLHGLMRSSKSLGKMARFLKKEGQYEVINFEYASSRALVTDHARALRSVIDQLGPDVTEINFFGHSLGNIVVRHYLNDTTDPESGRQGDPRINRIVMCGPPNQGSRMAQVLKHSFLFKVIAGASGGQLSNSWEELEKQLATPSHPFGIIAGGQNDDQILNNFILNGKDDFTVSVAETRLEGASDFLLRPLLHSTMMNQPEVLKATLSFFQNGYFVSEEDRQPIPASADSPGSTFENKPGRPIGLPTSGRLVGIDYGTVRIGIAISDPSQTISSPLENYSSRDRDLDGKYFIQLAEREQVVGFVVGLPVHMSGDASQKSNEAIEFGQWLEEITGLPVGWVDERYSTAHARELLNQTGMSAKKKKARLDKMAAQILLSTFLNSDAARAEAHKKSAEPI